MWLAIYSYWFVVVLCCMVACIFNCVLMIISFQVGSHSFLKQVSWQSFCVQYLKCSKFLSIHPHLLLSFGDTDGFVIFRIMISAVSSAILCMWRWRWLCILTASWYEHLHGILFSLSLTGNFLPVNCHYFVTGMVWLSFLGGILPHFRHFLCRH